MAAAKGFLPSSATRFPVLSKNKDFNGGENHNQKALEAVLDNQTTRKVHRIEDVASKNILTLEAKSSTRLSGD